MTTSGIRAGRAFVELGLKADGLERGLKQAQSRMRNFGRATQRMGMELTKIAATIAIPVALSSKVFMDFEKQMAEVSTMLDKPMLNMDRFRKRVREISIDFGQTTQAVAGGLYDILSASVAPAQALNVLDSSAKAAVAGLSDVKTAADAITTILNAYKLAAEDAAEVSDFLFTVVKKGKTTFNQLAPNIGKVATFAAGAGVSLDEMGAAIASLTRNGLGTEDAITALRAVITAFIKPQQQAKDAAKELGIELSATALEAEGLESMLKKFEGVNMSQLGKIFPNVRALVGLGPLLQDIDAFGADIEDMAGKVGATQKAFDKMDETASAAFGRMKSSVVDLGISIGQSLDAEMTSLFNDIRDIMKVATEWVGANKKLITGIVSLGAALGVTGLALTAFGFTVTQVSVAMGALISAFGALKVASLWLLANPIALAIAGITLAIGGLIIGMNKLMEEVTALNREMKSLLATGDASRASSLDLGKRLQVLAGKQALSTAEMIEAKIIVEQLESKYGDMGIRLNDITQSLEGAAEAQARLNEAMRLEALDDATAAIKEHRENVNLLKADIMDLDRQLFGDGGGARSGTRRRKPMEGTEDLANGRTMTSPKGGGMQIPFVTPNPFSINATTDEKVTKLRELLAMLKEEEDLLDKVENRMQYLEIKEAAVNALTGDPTGNASGSIGDFDRTSNILRMYTEQINETEGVVRSLEQAVADLNEEQRRRGFTEAEKEIASINDFYEEQADAIKAVIEKKKELAQIEDQQAIRFKVDNQEDLVKIKGILDVDMDGDRTQQALDDYIKKLEDLKIQQPDVVSDDDVARAKELSAKFLQLVEFADETNQSIRNMPLGYIQAMLDQFVLKNSIEMEALIKEVKIDPKAIDFGEQALTDSGALKLGYGNQGKIADDTLDRATDLIKRAQEEALKLGEALKNADSDEEKSAIEAKIQRQIDAVSNLMRIIERLRDIEVTPGVNTDLIDILDGIEGLVPDITIDVDVQTEDAMKQLQDLMKEMDRLREEELRKAKEARDKKAAEDADRDAAIKQKPIDNFNENTQDSIEKLKIQTTKRGMAMRMALLELERKHAIREAKKIGASVAKVNEEYNLRAKLLKQQDNSDTQSARGAFQNLWSLEGGGNANTQTKIATQSAATAKNTGATVTALDKLLNQIGKINAMNGRYA